MPIRSFTEADISDVASLCARACADDALLGDLMHPHRKEYPSDFIEHFRRRLSRHLHDSNRCHVVAYVLEQDGEVITGYADWLYQNGSHEGAHALTTHADAEHVFHNRAADPEMADVIERAEQFTKHYWADSRAQTWLLDFLMVDPQHQRKGFGRELVSFGLELAARDEICASLIASKTGEALYSSCGFEGVGYVQEGEGNPLAGLPGGRIMFWEDN